MGTSPGWKNRIYFKQWNHVCIKLTCQFSCLKFAFSSFQLHRKIIPFLIHTFQTNMYVYLKLLRGGNICPTRFVGNNCIVTRCTLTQLYFHAFSKPTNNPIERVACSSSWSHKHIKLLRVWAWQFITQASKWTSWDFTVLYGTFDWLELKMGHLIGWI